MPSKSRLGQTPRDLSAGKIPFLRSKGEGRSWRRWRKPPRRKEDSPLWKCQARRVNIWQPPSELPLISSLFSISEFCSCFQDGTSATDRLEPYGQLFLSNQCKHFRLASISPEGRSCLFHQPGIRFRVSFVFGWNHLVSPPITVIFIPQMGMENSGLNFGFESLDLCEFHH